MTAQLPPLGTRVVIARNDAEARRGGWTGRVGHASGYETSHLPTLVEVTFDLGDVAILPPDWLRWEDDPCLPPTSQHAPPQTPQEPGA